MTLRLHPWSGFWGQDKTGRWWTCHTVTNINPHTKQITSTTYWRHV